MSTRATISVTDKHGRFDIYQHHDGYPDGPFGIVRRLSDARRRAWDLPRFEAADFAAAVVATLKDCGGSTYLTKRAEDHGDREFSYRLHPIRKGTLTRIGLIIKQYSRVPSSSPVIFDGDLDEAVLRYETGQTESNDDPELSVLTPVGGILCRAAEEIQQLAGNHPDTDTKEVLEQIDETCITLSDLQSDLDRAQPWQALTKAEQVLADPDEARRKGYTLEAKARVFAAMDQHRAYQRRTFDGP